MKTINVTFPMAVAALVALLLGIGWWGYHYELPVFIFPLCIGLFVIAMASLAAIAAYRARDEQAQSVETKTDEAQAAAAGHSEAEGLLLERATWIQLGCVLGLMVLCWVLGFVAGIVIFLSAYLMCFGWKPWFSALCGLSFGLAIWLLFGLLFVTPLPFWPIFVR